MNSKPIGVFDSGIGGLSLIDEIRKTLPNESIIYFADRANFPYGDKPQIQIRKIAGNNVAWLLNQRVKLIVIACNTATISAITYLREKFPNISFVGMEPAVKPASAKSKKGIIILSSPKATKSKQLRILINNYANNIKVFNIGSLELVQAIEEEWDPAKIDRILEVLLPQKIICQADKLVLGCTHFSLIRDQIQKHIGIKIEIIDSREAVARRIKSVLREGNLLNTKTNAIYKFCTTGKAMRIRDISFKRVVIHS